MSAKLKIYHITHLRNLRGILEEGMLWSDAKRLELGLDCEVVGMHAIKRRRLERLEVGCHPGTKVGDYVPFYFCPRSVMLYILHKGNHPNLDYTEGQRPIMHLQAGLQSTVDWAEENDVRWAFSDRNAGAFYAEFFKSVRDARRIDWKAVLATDWRDPVVKEGKQAEWLVHESFPWSLVEKIGVLHSSVAQQVRSILKGADHQPTVAVERGWYY